MTTPSWLTKHEGEVRASHDGRSWSVMFSGKPHYVLEAVPAGGKFCCRVVQTISAKQLDKGRLFNSLEEACQGGLEDLRNALGW